MMRSPYFWIALIGLIASVDLVAFGYLIARSSGDPTFAVEANYYEKGLDWDKEMAQRRVNEQLGWRVSVKASEASGNERVVRIAVTDRDGAPIAGAQVAVETFANARASRRFERRGHTDEAGACTFRVSVEISGFWEARVRVIGLSGDQFTQVTRFMMPRIGG